MNTFQGFQEKICVFRCISPKYYSPSKSISSRPMIPFIIILNRDLRILLIIFGFSFSLETFAPLSWEDRAGILLFQLCDGGWSCFLDFGGDKIFGGLLIRGEVFDMIFFFDFNFFRFLIFFDVFILCFWGVSFDSLNRLLLFILDEEFGLDVFDRNRVHWIIHKQFGIIIIIINNKGSWLWVWSSSFSKMRQTILIFLLNLNYISWVPWIDIINFIIMVSAFSVPKSARSNILI